MSNYKIVRVVGNAGSPSKADKLIAVPKRRRCKRKEEKPLCNCAKRRGKHERTNDCIE